MNAELTINGLVLPAILKTLKNSRSLVLFAHGSGSGRLSERNNYVASVLNEAGIATLLFDLLTPEEDLMFENRFDIDLISGRLLQAIKWTEAQADLRDLKKGLFGASTGAAAAIQAAAQLPDSIQTIISRGGRPDLAFEWLEKVSCPILLIVGKNDPPTVEYNKEALKKLPQSIEKKLLIIPEATHLFEEPGKLEEVAEKAKEWFLEKL